jgi:hypothetical protein
MSAHEEEEVVERQPVRKRAAVPFKPTPVVPPPKPKGAAGKGRPPSIVDAARAKPNPTIPAVKSKGSVRNRKP